MDRGKSGPDDPWIDALLHSGPQRRMSDSIGPTRGAACGPRVGLLGGSFNPAHAGHRNISLLALKRLQLDQVWWLISPQNPLKSTAGMAPYAERLASARETAGNRRIQISEAEAELGTQYTVDTLQRGSPPPAPSPPFRVDYGGRQLAPSHAVAAVDRYLRNSPRCGLRPPHLFFPGIGWHCRDAVCPLPVEGTRGRNPG